MCDLLKKILTDNRVLYEHELPKNKYWEAYFDL